MSVDQKFLALKIGLCSLGLGVVAACSSDPTAPVVATIAPEDVPPTSVAASEKLLLTAVAISQTSDSKVHLIATINNLTGQQISEPGMSSLQHWSNGTWSNVGYVSNATTETALLAVIETCDVEPAERFIGINQSEVYLRYTDYLPEGYYRLRVGTLEQVSAVSKYTPS